jgi:hypothetical protein
MIRSQWLIWIQCEQCSAKDVDCTSFYIEQLQVKGKRVRKKGEGEVDSKRKRTEMERTASGESQDGYVTPESITRQASVSVLSTYQGGESSRYVS